MSEINEMKSLTLNGKTYDSFPDQDARGKLPLIVTVNKKEDGTYEATKKTGEIMSAYIAGASVWCHYGEFLLPPVSLQVASCKFGCITDNGEYLQVSIDPTAGATISTKALGNVKTVNGIGPDASGNVRIKSVLSGKTIAVLGDSISSVDYTTPNYWQRIAQKTGCTFVNHGVSASRIAASEHPLGIAAFVERYVDMTTEADAVIIMGGTNDVGNSQLGAWTSTDTATLYGALNTLLPDLCVRYPGKPIVFFAPMRMMNEALGAVPPTYADLAQRGEAETLTMPYVRLAIMAKCEQYGIPYIHTDKLSGINGNDTEGVYYRNKDTGEKDVLHPSEYGVACLANIVQTELEKRFVHAVGDSTDTDGGDTGDTGDTGDSGSGDTGTGDDGGTTAALELTLANDSITSDATDESNKSNIDGTTVLVPGYYASNGNFGELEKMHITNFINVEGYTKVEYYTYMGPNYYTLTFHDASGGLLKDVSVLVPSDATIGFWDGTVEIPETAVYVRLAGYHTTAQNNGYMKLYS